jgi:hypothetical protein
MKHRSRSSQRLLYLVEIISCTSFPIAVFWCGAGHSMLRLLEHLHGKYFLIEIVFLQARTLRSELDLMQAKLERAKAAATSAQTWASNLKKASDAKEKAQNGKMEKMRRENEELKLQIAGFIEEVKTFADGQYLPLIREVYYDLLELAIGAGRCEEVNRIVLGKLGKRSIGKLPSESLSKEFYREMLAMSHLHLAELFGGGEEEDDTLHLDGTSKWQDKFNGYQLTRLEPVRVERDGRMVTELVQRGYTLGMRQVVDGTAETVLEGLKQIMGDVERAQRAIDPTSAKGKVVTNIVSKFRNTMSDR